MANDTLPVGVIAGHHERPRIGATLPHDRRPAYVDQPTLRVISGPQQVGAHALSVLTHTRYRLASQCDRMGYRLEGRELPHPAAYPQISDGSAMGALQVPPDGQPILLMADGPPTGGYPKLAVVISADLPQTAQLQPGDTVTFRSSTLAEAEAAFSHQWRRINEVLPQVT
jgi:antagonist of KipI